MLSICMAGLIASHAWAHTNIRYDSIPQHVLKYASQPPVFPGSVETGLPRYMQRHFVYPRRAWKADPKEFAYLTLVIGDNGKVCSVKTDENMHSELKKELTRLFMNMPAWYPAYQNGKPVAVEYNCQVPLCDVRQMGLPWHLLPMIARVNKYGGMGKVYKKGITSEEMNNALNDMKEVEYMAPRAAEVTVPFTRMLLTQKVYDGAINLINKGVEEYAGGNSFETQNVPAALKQGTVRPGYDGKTEVLMTLLRAMTYDEAGQTQMASEAYRAAIDLIEKKLENGDIARPLSGKKGEEANEEALRLLRDEVASTFKNNASVTPNTSRWERVTRWLTLEEAGKQIDFMVKQGLINNAQARQSYHLIKQIAHDRAYGRTAAGDVLKLHGIKVLALYLSGGSSAAYSYIDNTVKATDTGKKLVNYLLQIKRKMEQQAPALAHHREVLHSIAAYAPSADEKAMCIATFYQYRKVVESIFPLQWMFSGN